MLLCASAGEAIESQVDQSLFDVGSDRYRFRHGGGRVQHLYLAIALVTCPMTYSPLVAVIGISISYKMTCLAQLCTDILELRSSSECRRNLNGCFDFPRFVRNWSTLMCPWWIGPGSSASSA